MLPVLEKPLLPRHEEPSPTPHLDGTQVSPSWGVGIRPLPPAHRSPYADHHLLSHLPSLLLPVAPPPTSLNLTWMFLPPPHPSLTDTR